ncbi:gamma-interferon-inducible lysosomal thiol reductase-like [Eriocheir sinensis]|uniref:gamma-interferon-inducible lysosomal thiol reductase-like n=1 Tax=Eriocheir sinensis TaxID=95602 RepID=UPI0021C94D70|nr:gamma-interferon-inducible lysosomal thiol reductase-like [Eriocheir sinensis]
MAFRHLLALALLPLVLGAAAPKKTKVSVYYEALSPKSKAFFTTQLYPVWLELRDYIALDLYLYGRTQETVAANGYSFSCIHGAEECVGNIMMMCAKHNIPTVDQLMSFSNCIMDKFQGAAATAECAELSQVDYNRINECATTFEGQNLMHTTGVKQQSVSPDLSSAPWILINDVFSEEVMMAAREDLRAVVCAANENIPKNMC